VTAPSGGYTGGQMVKINDVVGVIVPPLDTSGGGTTAPTIAAGTLCAFIFKAPMIVVPCLAATTGYYADKEKVYFDESEAEVTQESSGNTLCGIVLEDSETGDEEVLIALDGMLGIVS